MKINLRFSRAGKHASRSRAGNALVILLLALVACFMGMPLVYAVMQSLKPMHEIFIFPPRFYVVNPTIENFYMLTQYTNNLWVPFTRYLYNSVMYTAVATFAQIIVCSMAAYVLSKGTLKRKGALFAIVVTTLLFSYDVTAIPTYVVMSSLSLINTAYAIILPVIASSMGLFLLKQNMDVLPDALIEAARIDGATPFRTYWSVVMPNVKPAWLTLVIFAFQQIWNREGLEYIYSEDLKVLPTVFRQISAGGISRAGVGAAAAVVLMLPPIVTFIMSQSRVLETMTHSGIK